MPPTAPQRPVGRRKGRSPSRKPSGGNAALRRLLRPTPADRLIRMLTEHGLGPFETEYPFARAALNRGWLFDIAWPRLGVAVEIEGGIFGKGGPDGGKPCVLCKQMPKGAHGSASGILRDIEKYNAGLMLGWRIYRVPTNAITWETVRTIAVLLEIARHAERRRPGRLGSRPRVSTSRQSERV